MKNIDIIAFKSEFAQDFAKLNIEWLEKYFVVEPHDAALMQRCEETIIDVGGHIFFARVDGSLVGTVALIPMEEKIFELGKMAVSEAFQGMRIGQRLMRYCIDFGREQGWKKLVLYSNTVLENAIYIYRKYGFVEVPQEANPPYARSNIKMICLL